MNSLFDSVTAGSLHLKNCTTMAALTWSLAEHDGVPAPMHVQYYAQ